jgi:hypothetical protein
LLSPFDKHAEVAGNIDKCALFVGQPEFGPAYLSRILPRPSRNSSTATSVSAAI